MIPAPNTMTQVNELPGEEFEFGIGDPRWMMRNNADMYSNRELAVLREYSTNAMDASAQKALLEGTEVQPIEVSLPSAMSPEFSVRDHGYGMDKHTLTQVYTQFGISTKRNSNNYSGMLGLGSKAALAYTSQFTIISVSAGRKIVAVVTRRPDWSIGLKIVSDAPSTEATGTTIKVPVHNPEEFTKKAYDFYRFWLPGTVKVNGTEVDHFAGEEVIDGLYKSGNYNSYIVMGGVPYRIENPDALFVGTSMLRFNFVAYLNTGEVEFVPNREALKYTDLTKKALHAMMNGFSQQLLAQCKKDIAAAQTHAEAFDAWHKWSSILKDDAMGELVFKGDALEKTFNVHGFKYRYGESGFTIKSHSIVAAKDVLFVTGFTAPPSASQKSKVRQYKDFKRLSHRYPVVFVYSDTVDCPWLDTTADNFIAWEDLKVAVPKKSATRTPRTGSSRKAGTFDAYVKGKKIEEIEVPSNHKKVFRISPAAANSFGLRPHELISALPAEHQDITVVVVPANRLNKFMRDYPQVKHFSTWAKGLVITDLDSLVSEELKMWKSMSHNDRMSMHRLAGADLKDPALVKLVKVACGPEPEGGEYERNYRLACQFGMREQASINLNYDSPLGGRYPLASHNAIAECKDEVVFYMNAKYEAEQASARKDEDE